MEITIVLLLIISAMFMMISLVETVMKKHWRGKALDERAKNESLQKENEGLISDMRIIAGDDYHNIVETTAKWKTIFELEEMAMSGSPNDKGDGMSLTTATALSLPKAQSK